MSSNLEKGSQAGGYALELRAIAAFIEEHPQMAEGRTLGEAITDAADALFDLSMVAFAEADDFDA